METAENALNDRNLESAVLMVTATGAPESVNFTGNPSWSAGINTVGGGWKVWIEAVTTELQKLSETAQNRIYTGEMVTVLPEYRGGRTAAALIARSIQAAKALWVRW